LITVSSGLGSIIVWLFENLRQNLEEGGQEDAYGIAPINQEDAYGIAPINQEDATIETKIQKEEVTNEYQVRIG